METPQGIRVQAYASLGGGPRRGKIRPEGAFGSLLGVGWSVRLGGGSPERPAIGKVGKITRKSCCFVLNKNYSKKYLNYVTANGMLSLLTQPRLMLATACAASSDMHQSCSRRQLSSAQTLRRFRMRSLLLKIFNLFLWFISFLG